MTYNFTWQKSSKYGNNSTIYNGRRYDSKFEARVAMELDLELKAGVYTEIIPQCRIKLYARDTAGQKIDICIYICDFRCERPDGTYHLVEAKGHPTDTYRMKRKLLECFWLPDHLDYSFEERHEAKGWRGGRR